jgi:membrane protease subunit HflC
MNRALIAGVVIAVALAFILANSLFVVDQVSEALVLQFGSPVRVITDPGLQIKIPFIQTAAQFDNRVLDYEPPGEEVIGSDQKRLVVDTYCRYRITDPLKFYQSVGTEDGVQLRLGSTISAALRQVIGDVDLSTLLSPQRSAIMHQIRDIVRAQSEAFGIDVIDVRIRRADLPEENSEAIYARMQSERAREAKQFRAEGYEVAQGIKAEADLERTVILANAARQAQISRGKGDAQSIDIYAKAFGEDPEFYAFYRSLQAYRTVFGTGSTFVLTPENPFLKYLSPVARPSTDR